MQGRGAEQERAVEGDGRVLARNRQDETDKRAYGRGAKRPEIGQSLPLLTFKQLLHGPPAALKADFGRGATTQL